MGEAWRRGLVTVPLELAYMECSRFTGAYAWSRRVRYTQRYVVGLGRGKTPLGARTHAEEVAAV